MKKIMSKITRERGIQFLGIVLLLTIVSKQIQITINNLVCQSVQLEIDENERNRIIDTGGRVLQVSDPSEGIPIRGMEVKENSLVSFDIDNLSRADITMLIKDSENNILFQETLMKGTYLLRLPSKFDGNLVLSFEQNQFTECIVDFGEVKSYPFYILFYEVAIVVFGIACIVGLFLYRKGLCSNPSLLTKAQDKKFCFLLFLAFFIYLCIQHYVVGLYFDDWSYLSLSYHYKVDGVRGGDYNFGQILEFLKGHYQVWGGRILYFGVLILAAGVHIGVYKLLQSIVLLVIFYIMYKMITRRFDNKKWFTTLVLCSLYGVISIEVHNNGTYWFTASSIYILPLLPALVLLYQTVNWSSVTKVKNNRRIAVVSGILAFLATFSQEQIAFGVMGVLTIQLVVSILQKKQRKWLYSSWIMGFIGFLCLYLAPGNQIRMQEENLTIYRRIIQAVYNTIFGIFNRSFFWFLVIFIAYICYACAWRIHRKQGNIITCRCYLIFTCIVMGRFFIGKGMYFTELRYSDKKYTRLFWLGVLIIYLIWSMGELGYYLLKREQRHMFYLLLFAMLTLIPCFYSSYFAERMALPTLISLLGIIGNGLVEIREDHLVPSKMVHMVTTGMMILCWIQLIGTTIGYANNYTIYRENEKQLEQAACENWDTVVLKKNRNDTYASYMPYQGGPLASYVEDSMKRYYGISEVCVIEWEN